MSSQLAIGGAESSPPQQQRPLSTMNRSGTNSMASKASGTSHEMRSFKEMKATQQRGESMPISDQQLVNAIERAIKAVQGPRTSLDFSIHKSTKQIMVKVLDRETGEVIREVPPEKQLDLLAKLWEMAGILVDEKR